MGVNDLARAWRNVAERHRKERERLSEEEESPYINERIEHHETAVEHRDWVANEIENVAHTSWHTISELPTEEDGDDYGFVLICAPEVGERKQEINLCHWKDLDDMAFDDFMWARIRDVVLLPQ